MKAILKRTLPASWNRRLRRLGRLRWLTKARLLRSYGFDPRADPLLAASFVLLDPEVESHSYELANEEEMARFLAALLRVGPEVVRPYLAEARSDPVLGRDRGWRLSIKRRTPLGRRLAWYAIARVTKPRVVVETGIHDGLGSEALLRALERNAAEGSPGQLISFDLYDDTGWAVAPALRPGWQRVIGSTYDVLAPALAGRAVDLFIRDTPPIDALVRHELGVAMRHAAPTMIVVDSSGEGAIALREICRDLPPTRRGEIHVFADRPLNHVLRQNPHAYARFDPAPHEAGTGPEPEVGRTAAVDAALVGATTGVRSA